MLINEPIKARKSPILTLFPSKINLSNSVQFVPHVTMTLSLDDIIPMANPDTGVILLDGKMTDDIHTDIYYSLDFEYYDDDEALGPDCYLCGLPIYDLSNPLTSGDDKFTILWKDDLKGCDWDACTLQCAFCLNFFHRTRCNLTMTDDSYLNTQITKSWSCPSCVPSFQSKSRQQGNINTFKLLTKLAKILNPLLKDPLPTNVPMNECIFDMYVVLKGLFINYDFG